jgi:hypothetical protein
VQDISGKPELRRHKRSKFVRINPLFWYQALESSTKMGIKASLKFS